MKTRVEELERCFGVPSFALHRADLHQMLADRLDGIEPELHSGDPVLAATTGGVT